VVRLAVQAVEGDSISAVAQRWSTRLAQDSSDPAALLGLAALAQLTYQYPKADSLYLRLYSIADTGHERWAVLGRITQAKGFISSGRLESADSLLARSGEEARALNEPAAEAQALIQLARIRARTAGPAAAARLLDRATPLIPPDDPQLHGHWTCARAQVLAFQGDTTAVEQARRGQALAKRAGDRRLEAQCLATIGQYQSFRGTVSASLATFAEVIVLLRWARDRAALAAAHHWRGYRLRTVGRLGEARQEAMQAIAEGEVSGNTVAQAWSLLTMAQISAVLGDGAPGTDYIRRSITLHEGNGDQLGLATALVVEGELAEIQGRRDEAERTYRRGVDWAKTFEDPHRLAWAYNKLASLARSAGDWSQAAMALDSSRSVALRHDMSGWVRIIRYDFGALALERDRLDEAEDLLVEHLEALRSDEHITRYMTRARLAEIHARRGSVERAETEFSLATGEFDRWRATLSEDELRIMVFQYAADQADRDLGVASIISVLAEAGRTDSAFGFVERRRARELLDRMVRIRALHTPDSGSQAETPFTGGAPLTLPQVRNAIPDDRTAIMAFVTGRGGGGSSGGGEPTTLFVVSRDYTATHRLVPIDSLTDLVTRFTSLVESGSVPEALARRLGDVLIAPAIQKLPERITRLLIVPDDVLHRLPFEALRLSDDRWLVERFSVSLMPSASVAVHLWQRTRDVPNVAILALGDAAFNRDSASDRSGPGETFRPAFDRPGGLPRLAASAGEARAIARYGSQAVVRLGGDASESFVKGEPLDGYDILHFATHALVDEHALTRTALALSPGDGDDGFVTAAELAQLHLDADLVVLSACETAGGVVIGGEGIEGLTAPLLQAGARSVVATRWPLGDKTTANLVEEFYRFQAEGMSVGDALHAVKLAALNRGESSATWATFTVVGDPFVQLALRRPRSRAPWAALAALALVVGYFGWMRRRRGAART
jgi:CHAT domain-containing protein/tetratricopeptide (TPR) repeat protein